MLFLKIAIYSHRSKASFLHRIFFILCLTFFLLAKNWEFLNAINYTFRFFFFSVATLQRPCCIRVKSFFMTDCKLPNLAQNIQKQFLIAQTLFWLFGFIVTYFCSYLHIYLVLWICLRAPIIEQSSCDRWDTTVKLVPVQRMHKPRENRWMQLKNGDKTTSWR